MDKHELISGLLGAFTRAVSEALSETGPEDIELNWSLHPNLGEDPLDGAGAWAWWSGGLSTHSGANFFIGAPDETWEKLGRGGSSENTRENAFALVSRCFAKAVGEQLGDRAAAQDAGASGAPSKDWTRVSIEIRYPAGEWPSAGCVLSPEFEDALGDPEKTDPAPAPVRSPASSTGGRMNPSDMLMHVQVPVSVSFGATQIRMKDLLSLTTGSVVELDQALHDNVEVRVNDRVIARGEVVAVDGHYGVRVLELVSGESPAGGFPA
jgi:flagellar motor switch protein FliN/FliY